MTLALAVPPVLALVGITALWYGVKYGKKPKRFAAVHIAATLLWFCVGLGTWPYMPEAAQFPAVIILYTTLAFWAPASVYLTFKLRDKIRGQKQ